MKKIAILAMDMVNQKGMIGAMEEEAVGEAQKMVAKVWEWMGRKVRLGRE